MEQLKNDNLYKTCVKHSPVKFCTAGEKGYIDYSKPRQ